MTAESIFNEPGRWHVDGGEEEVAFVWDLYSIAYKESADLLVDRFLDWPESEFYAACPIMFLYRHYLELKLKQLRVRLDRWHGVADDLNHLRLRRTQVPFSVYGHGLNGSWGIVCSLLEQMSGESLYSGALEDFETRYDDIAARISEFDRLDDSSMVFRYPTNNDGVRFPVNLPDRTALEHLKSVVEGIASDLDAIGMAVESSEEAIQLEFDDGVEGYFRDLQADLLK